MKIVKMNCPNCGATLAFGDSISNVTCEHCGQTFTIDDKASEIDRISAAQTEASRRDVEIERKRIELQLEAEKRKNDENLRVERRRTLRDHLPIMFLFGLVIILFLWLGISSCIDTHKREVQLAALADKGIENGVNVPDRESSYVGQNYQAVRMSFESAGFSNIECVPMGDLVTGLLNSDGEVASVVINGGSFEEGEQFEPDALVLISYHSYPERTTASESQPTEEAAELYDEASYMATAIGDITYVYPSSWGVSSDASGRMTYNNAEGTINMFVSVSQTDVSIEDEDFEDYIAVMAEDVFAGDYEVSFDQVGGHNARCASGMYSGTDNVKARIYYTDYSEGILIVGFLYTLDVESDAAVLERDLLSAFIFSGRGDIVYAQEQFGNITYDIPETWEITQQSNDAIVYTSPDSVILMINYQEGDFSISDEGFIETVESQIIWDDLTSELITIDDKDAYYITGINNDDGGYVCRLYTMDSEPGIVSLTFYYYEEYELLYAPQIEHIIETLDVLA